MTVSARFAGLEGYFPSKYVSSPHRSGEHTVEEAVDVYQEYRELAAELTEPDIPELANGARRRN